MRKLGAVQWESGVNFNALRILRRRHEDTVKIGRLPPLLSIDMTVAAGGSATLCAIAQMPANAADPAAPTAATLTPEQIDAQ